MLTLYQQTKHIYIYVVRLLVHDVIYGNVLVDQFCVSRKGGTGELGGCAQRVRTTWPCPDLNVKALVGTG